MADDDQMLAVTEMNPAQRIQYLERSLLFLRQQHSDVLHSLHEEVMGLKKENKELQFKIVMSQKAAQAMREERLKEKGEVGEKKEGQDSEETEAGDASETFSYSKLLEDTEKSKAEEKNTEMKIVFLEEEVKELKHALRETRNRNQYLTQLLEQAEEQRKKQPEIAYIRENVSLPALRQTVGNKAVERRKRTQVLQRAKLRPGAMPP
ncbi:coiled-coil domain-containing protein 74A [Elysia marginata]|uniref:Coiled-coil domain-containing protein 74A n=1 Tax=Elysia marginata TaxID=1093978 RepID=A0AAV4GYM1_9GAST|nr:coiled-coil domain-containing protein 74A [Elysia marginata]